MAKIRDRTEDYKDAVRAAALSFGYTEARLASIMASFIMHKPPQRSWFTKAAMNTMESINELEQFIIKHRKDYTDLHRATEQERDNIEHEVSTFIKACKEQIDILKNRIHEDVNSVKSRKWLGGDSPNADVIAHKHGVVLILSERLHYVTAQFDKLRSIRFQYAINRVMPRRKMLKKPVAKSAESSIYGTLELREEQHPSNSGSLQVQDQLLDDETRALKVELTSLLDAAQETETKMVEMSALNHLMSTHVLQQAKQIEFLYDQAIEATKNVELGNKELTQAIKRNSSSRTFLLLFLFVLTFSILFLDWYS